MIAVGSRSRSKSRLHWVRDLLMVLMANGFGQWYSHKVKVIKESSEELVKDHE